MLNDFPRTLSLLRTEKKISQRKAAKDLLISQALLSHYENGVREPGLEFVVRAADYYSVSCDYLLGRTMSREYVNIKEDVLPDASEDKDNVLKGNISVRLNKKLIVNSVALLMEVLDKMGDVNIISSVSSYLSIAVYKMYRYVYLANNSNDDSFFPLPAEFFSEACDAEMKKNEIKLKSSALGISPEGGRAEHTDSPELSHQALTEAYPTHAQSLLTLLHSVSEKIEKNIK